MTNQEAIMMAKAKLKCIENETSGRGELCSRECDDCDLNYAQGNMGEQQEWLKESISAMEKQTPKKPVEKDDGFGDTWTVCPNCGSAAIENMFRQHELYPYCPWCGQKLEQEDSNAEQ